MVTTWMLTLGSWFGVENQGDRDKKQADKQKLRDKPADRGPAEPMRGPVFFLRDRD